MNIDLVFMSTRRDETRLSIRPEGASPLYTIQRNIYQTSYKNLTVFGASRGNQISGDLPKEVSWNFYLLLSERIGGEDQNRKNRDDQKLKTEFIPNGAP